MNHVTIREDKDTITIQVPKDKSLYKPSTSGKTKVLGTGGFQRVSEYSISLNCTLPNS